MDYFKKIIEENYKLNIEKIEKSNESTVGNVYIIYDKNKKYVLKIYDDLKHTESMVLLHDELSNYFNIPKIIYSINKKLYIQSNNQFLVLYSFLDGIQIGRLDRLDSELITKIAIELRKLHNLTSINKYNLEEINLCENKLERKSLLHFDLTKGNIFYNEETNNIGFIDFDDAKYGDSIYDVSILISLLFFSKKRGVDSDNIKLFIDSYYGNDEELKNNEIKFIKEIATNWIDLTLENNEFNPSTKESFEVKKDLIEKTLCFNNIRLIPFKECVDIELYNMYQDIPFKELGSSNVLCGVSYDDFIKITNKYVDEETNLNEELNTTTSRFILYDNDTPIGEAGIRTTKNDFWINKGSQIYYKIRKSKRGKGYGNEILKLVLIEAKKIGFNKVRINCDNKNTASKKIILKNGGKVDIENYETSEGISSSYIINLIK